MKRKRLIILISIVSIVTTIAAFNRHALAACYSVITSKFNSPDLAYVKANEWSYQEGFKIGGGDFLEFKSDIFSLRSDTILVKDNPKAIVTELNTYFNQVTVRSITSNEKGVYINIEEFTR